MEPSSVTRAAPQRGPQSPQPTAARRRGPVDPSAEHLHVRDLVATPAERRARRRRALIWTLLTVVSIAGLVALVDVLSRPPGPEAVAERIHGAVQREAAAQSGDPTLVVGPLDCVELRPGAGNCLADLRSSWRPTGGTLVAVGYGPGEDGDLTWKVSLP